MAYRAGKKLPESIFNDALYSNTLSLWFKNLPPNTLPGEKLVSQWFGMGDAADRYSFDGECKKIGKDALDFLGPTKWNLPLFVDTVTDRHSASALTKPFEDAIQQASQSDNNTLHKTDIALAIVLLLDQFPRNIFRAPEDEQMVFSHYDRLAMAIARSIASPVAVDSNLAHLDEDSRVRMDVTRRNWFYLPLMHSEDLSDHHLLASKLAAMRRVMLDTVDQAAVRYVEKIIASKTDTSC